MISFARDIIPEDKFRMLSAAYENGQKKLKADMDVGSGLTGTKETI